MIDVLLKLVFHNAPTLAADNWHRPGPGLSVGKGILMSDAVRLQEMDRDSLLSTRVDYRSFTAYLSASGLNFSHGG